MSCRKSRGEHLLHSFLPNKHVENIFQIEPSFLQEINKSGILVDLDNTLVPWNVHDAPKDVKEWLEKMVTANIKVTIFSNNSKARVGRFATPLDIPYIYRAKKPLPFAFKRAMNLMELSEKEIVVIGDQLLTDVLGGNRAGFYTILVKPIVQSDAPITKLNRRIERIILEQFYRTGKLTRRVSDGE